MDGVMKFISLNVILWININRISEANKINLNDASTKQVGTWNNHYPNLAIDGNVNTYSVACDRCDANNPTDAIGWWKIDFNQEVEIAGVELISSNNQPDSDYLQEIVVSIAPQHDFNQGNVVKCGEHDSRNVSLPSNHKIAIVCPQKIRGRSVKIERKPGALIRPDAISIAEVNIYSERGNWISSNYGNNNPGGNNGNVCRSNDKNDPNCVNNGPNNNGQNNPNSNNPNNNYNNPSNNNNNPPNIRAQPEGRETLVKATTQSATYQNNQPDLAIDGRPDTFSIAVTNQNGQHGWWQADLGQSYQVTGLTIVSSDDYTNAQYLKNFEVLVSQLGYTQDPYFQQSQKCVTNSGRDEIPTKTLIAFKCTAPLSGRFVIIKSTTGPISLAEVKIYVQ